MGYDDLCMYCFEEMDGKTTCPHCGRDSRAAVPQAQLLPGTRVYRDRFLIGRALGQDASGIVYAAYDTKKDNRLRIREYLPRDCAERLNDGAVVPLAGMEDQFESGLRKLRASVEGVEDPRKRHFFFEENGTAYIAQRKSATQESAYVGEDEPEERGGGRRVLMFAGIAVAVLVAAAVLLITVFNGTLPTRQDITQTPTLDPSLVWIPETTPTATPYVAPTFAALVDPELTWMDYTYEGDVEQEYQEQLMHAQTPTPTPAPTAAPTATPERTTGGGYSLITEGSSAKQIRKLQARLAELGWLEEEQVTGEYDADTRQAVRNFQRFVNRYYEPDERLTVDGAAGPKTQQWLYEAEVTCPTPTPTPMVTPKDDEGIDEDSPAGEIRAMQEKLVRLGLLPGTAADGKYGATTRAAVRRFQERVNELAGYTALKVTGEMDPQSLAFLDYYVEWWDRLRKATAEPTATPKPTAAPTASPTPEPVEVSDDVIDADSPAEKIRMVQELLIEIGMLPKGSADGVYGSATLSAVADFQQWVNDQRKEETLTVNGAVDQLTLLYLRYCVQHGYWPYGAPTAVPTPKPTATPEPTEEPIMPEDELEEGEEDFSVGPASEHESIAYVQEMLCAVGALDEDGIDGVYGKGTERAVRNFQRWVNSVKGPGTLEETGLVDNRTRLALEYAYNHELRMEAAGAVAAKPTESPADEPEGPVGGTVEVVPPEPLEEVDEPEETDEPEEIEDIEEGEPDITIDEDSEPESILRVQQMLNEVGLLGEGSLTGVYDGDTVAAVRKFQRWVNSVKGEGTLEVTGIVDNDTRIMLEYASDRGMRYPGDGEEEQEVVKNVSEPSIVINGEAGGDDPVIIDGDSIEFSWAAEGDVAYYDARITDANGKTIAGQQFEEPGISMPTRGMKAGMVYTLTVSAVPEGGAAEDAARSSARFVRPEEEATTPEPSAEATEVPTPAPQVAVIGKPVVNVGGAAYQRDGIPYMKDSTIIINWKADGDVESYTLYVVNEMGERQELANTTDTNKTISTEKMPAGIYTIYVGALPSGGGPEDVQWGSTRFGIPAPTNAPDGGYGQIDADTDSETIEQLQVKLYTLGMLSLDAEKGVLDKLTLQAVARFQSENGLEALNPDSADGVVDAATVQAIFAAEVN